MSSIAHLVLQLLTTTKSFFFFLLLKSNSFSVLYYEPGCMTKLRWTHLTSHLNCSSCALLYEVHFTYTSECITRSPTRGWIWVPSGIFCSAVCEVFRAAAESQSSQQEPLMIMLFILFVLWDIRCIWAKWGEERNLTALKNKYQIFNIHKNYFQHNEKNLLGVTYYCWE